MSAPATTPHTDPIDCLAAARGLRETVEGQAAAAEELRTLPEKTVSALWDSGLMRFMNPREAGGQEPSLREMIDVWQELSAQDGSVGWIGIANFPSAAFAAAYLPDEGFSEVFGDLSDRVTLGGQFAPNGVGNVVDGGYRITGSWNFGSGTGHSQFVVGGFIPMDGDEMRMADNGLPALMVAVFPREEVEFRDGWHVTGLKGTGSYDYGVTDVVVPEHRTFELFTRTPQRGGATFKLGIMPVTAAGHAAWALGVSRSALDDVVALAESKTRMGDETTLAHKMTFQRDLAHHEGMWRAARLLVAETYTTVYEAMRDGGDLTLEMRADMRLAATYATQASREVVEFAHLASGTSAIREGSRLERAFRDMYTGTQHTFIGEKTYVDIAKLTLKIDADNVTL
jgi:alkylation response protein AidB-like acyl-CoA dehydrogenase